jgi:hypothetical protein
VHDDPDELPSIWREISWRGMLSRRALMWSGLAVAIAVGFRLSEPPPPARPEPAVSRHEAATAPAAPAAIEALPRSAPSQISAPQQPH